jgi:signal transduction histidine kinase
MHLIALYSTVLRFAYAQWLNALLVFVVTVMAMVAAWCCAHQEARRRKARHSAALEERTRIAQEIHDTLLQSFSGITLQLGSIHKSLAAEGDGAAGRLSDVLTVADQTLRETRSVVWEMHAPELQAMDLADALGAAVRSTAGLSDVAVTYNVLGARRRLSPATETAMLRVGREAVVNAVRHSQARSIDVQLIFAPKSVKLRVQDDGRGLPGADAATTLSEGHWGLAGMRTRTERLGGTLDVSARPEGGTIVLMEIAHRGERGHGRSWRDRPRA